MYRAHSLNSFNSWLIHFLKERLTCGLSPWRGRAHPEHLEPSYYGHSIGHWEGDTIVVDTIGFNEKFWMDREGTPHTEELHLIERFTRTDFNTLKCEVTIDDPGATLPRGRPAFSFAGRAVSRPSNISARTTTRPRNFWSEVRNPSIAAARSFRKTRMPVFNLATL
jgi:hypothetical protein